MKIFKEILKANKIIARALNKTSLIPAEKIGRKLGVNLYFKPECFQKTGSFKIRGVLNRLYYLKPEEKKRGVVTLSAGDHALSLAFAAKMLGIPVVTIMPKTTPRNKIEKIKKLGAEIILFDGSLRSKCEEIQRERKMTLIHPFDDPFVIAGQGTIGLEILDEFPDVNAVFVPVGGGGLISGISAAIKSKKPKVKIIGVEPVGAPTMFQSIKQKGIIYLKKRETVAEALAAPYVGKYTLKYAKKYVDNWVLVSDMEIIDALRLIWKEHKIKVEPSGATAFAAILYQKIKLPAKSKVVCILSGGNIDKRRFQEFLKKV